MRRMERLRTTCHFPSFDATQKPHLYGVTACNLQGAARRSQMTTVTVKNRTFPFLSWLNRLSADCGADVRSLDKPEAGD
jgi:hypothetical protein